MQALFRNLRGLLDVPRMRIPRGVASSSPLLPIGSRSSLFNCFPYVFLLLWIVLHVSSLIFYYYWLLPSLPAPWSIYSGHLSPPPGMTVLFPYSCYSVSSIRTLCIQLPAEIGFYLSHPRLPLPVVLNVLLEFLSLSTHLIHSFFPHMRSSITLIPLAFSHRFRYRLSLSLSLPLLCRLFGSPLLLPCVFI